MKKKEEKITCENCGEKSVDWYKCYGKYFCSFKCLNKWEEENGRNK